MQGNASGGLDCDQQIMALPPTSTAYEHVIVSKNDSAGSDQRAGGVAPLLRSTSSVDSVDLLFLSSSIHPQAHSCSIVLSSGPLVLLGAFCAVSAAKARCLSAELPLFCHACIRRCPAAAGLAQKPWSRAQIETVAAAETEDSTFTRTALLLRPRCPGTPR